MCIEYVECCVHYYNTCRLFNIAAPAFDTETSTDKLKTYAQALGAEESLSGVVEDHSKHLGRREYREIIIETFESSGDIASIFS